MRKAHVIFVHGISSEVIKRNYAQALQDSIVKNLQEKKILHPNLTTDEISQVITFEAVNYSNIGQSEEDMVLQSYEKEKQRIFNFLDKAIDTVVLDQLRKQFITSFSDALAYESDYWKDKIRQTVLDKVNQYISLNEDVTIIGHSLGSVVSFDVAYYNSRHNKEWLALKFKPKNLFTLGSPIALFSLELDDKTGTQKSRYIPQVAMTEEMDPTNTNPDTNPIQENGVWYNFFDAQDVIGYPLEDLFKDKFKLKDIIVQTGTFPLQAHTLYWESKEVADTISEKLAQDIVS